MGLTLNYELRLPASATRESAAAILRELHAFAATLPFEEVSSLLLDDAEEFGVDGGWREALRFWASIVAPSFGDNDPGLTGDPSSAIGFFVQPGTGCETASFCLLRRLDSMGEHADWFWYCCCKTQYASNVSESHFVACHRSLVQLLDHAAACGFDVVVRDEAQYWETRDEAQLVASVRQMNRIVAGFAGQASDALGDEHNVRAPIFEHPRFERLEMGESE